MRSAGQDFRGVGRMVRGSVSSSGAVVTGTGFTVTRNGTGQYTVTFLQPFQAIPDVYLNGGIAAGTNGYFESGSPYATGFVCTWWQSSTRYDTAFQFLAMEAMTR